MPVQPVAPLQAAGVGEVQGDALVVDASSGVVRIKSPNGHTRAQPNRGSVIRNNRVILGRSFDGVDGLAPGFVRLHVACVDRKGHVDVPDNYQPKDQIAAARQRRNELVLQRQAEAIVEKLEDDRQAYHEEHVEARAQELARKMLKARDEKIALLKRKRDEAEDDEENLVIVQRWKAEKQAKEAREAEAQRIVQLNRSLVDFVKEDEVSAADELADPPTASSPTHEPVAKPAPMKAKARSAVSDP